MPASHPTSAPRFRLRCLGCEATRPPTVSRLTCDICDGLFRTEYLDPPSGGSPLEPVGRPQDRITLGEGNTPLVELRRLARELRLGRLWAKMEHVAPTGSFKDRGSAVLVSVAVEHGVTEFVEDSSGNAGASLSAYAAAAGIKAHVFAPAGASPGKLQQIEVFGAQLHRVEGPRQAATDAARSFVKERGLVYLSHSYSPFFSEGMKGFSYEIARSPAAGVRHIVFPVGNGSLLIGSGAGFAELIAAGVMAASPRLHCVQAAAVRPVVAVLNGESWQFDRAGRTVASGIAVSNPPRLEQAVDAVTHSAGAGVAVDDASILGWQRRLARAEGIFCEPTSAAALAGLEQLLQRGVIREGEEALLPITGTGLKEPLPA